MDAIPAIWKPLDIRYKDLSHLKVRTEMELSPRELRKNYELARLAEEVDCQNTCFIVLRYPIKPSFDTGDEG